MLAGAEIMIRAASTNVINITDFGLASWDFHQIGTGGSLNGSTRARSSSASGGFGDNRIAPIKTFLDAHAEPPRTATSSSRSRASSCACRGAGHGDGIVAAVFGKNVKQGLSFPVDGSRASRRHAGPEGFWAAIAAA